MPDTLEDTNYKYILLDNKYISSLTFKSLPEYIYFLDIVKDFPKDFAYSYSIYISKLDPIKAINDITFSIGASTSELSTINKNQKDIDILEKAKLDASYLRKKIQIENQEIYEIKLILTFCSNNFLELSKNILSIKSKFYSKGIISEITNFRHLRYYLNNTPINLNEKMNNKIYITTDCLSNIFPFYTENIIDENGVIIGKTNTNKLCIIDFFSNNYENANICIFGCSGSGKSYFTKLLIIRNYFFGNKQIVFDVENEYSTLCDRLEGENIFQSKFLNILEITKNDIDRAKKNNTNYLEYKILNVSKFLSRQTNINQKVLIKALYDTYNSYNITKDIKTIQKNMEGEKIFLDPKIISSNKFPTLFDLANHLDDKEKLLTCINTKLEFFSKTTNLDLNNRLLVIDMQKLINNSLIVEDIFKYIMEVIGNVRTIIYIDELWKYAKSENVLSEVFNMYKTIRKRQASIVTITQDITDYFEYQEGRYAKSILNNTCFKFFFKTEHNDISRFTNSLNIDTNISYLKKGQALLFVGNNNIKIDIKANEFERGIIDVNDNSSK